MDTTTNVMIISQKISVDYLVKDEPIRRPQRKKRALRSSTADKDEVKFDPDCIFYNRKDEKQLYHKGQKTFKKIYKFDFDGGESVKNVANGKSDEKLLAHIRGKDLFVVEASCHESCRRAYVTSKGARSTNNVEKKKTQH